ncbi:hypothetical protein [Spiroplasma endosymbiont of Diplazon laetatorius]|uniref:hypothetical protein n=1 Tax=Spiroplasma endosymbiont of Diplazon laetatorius TaxID=3066322 RepID=UPI0030CA6172
MNDSYTKASKNSIDEFNVFNENHFFNFDNLDRKIANNSKDINSYSSVWFSHVFSSIEEAYLKSTPNLNSDGEKWTKEHTKQLKELTLKLYNVLFNLIKNETWVQNILSALIISPDFPLVSDDSSLMENVMGYTNTSYYVDSSNNFYSTAYSYIVIAGPSLTFQKFNSQYKNAFWSSPNKFSVWIHEMGHVVDAFGSKTINYRSINYSKKLDYKNLYKGQFFGDYIVSSSGPILIWIFATFSGVTIIIIVVFYLVKKCKKKL